MKYMIAEDEAYAMNHLKLLINRLRPNWQLIFTSDNIEETIQWFQEGNKPDLCFFDIELSDGNIFEVINEISSDLPIIFTTAYDSYCLEAFKANSIGYVLKPIMEDDLEHALTKYEKVWQAQNGINVLKRTIASILSPPSTTPAQRILISSGDRYTYENIANIAWFFSEERYVFAITNNGQRLLTTFRSLGEAEDITDQQQFFRVSRNIISSISAISRISRLFKGRLKVELKANNEKMETVVSANRRVEFLSWIGAGTA